MKPLPPRRSESVLRLCSRGSSAQYRHALFPSPRPSVANHRCRARVIKYRSIPPSPTMTVSASFPNVTANIADKAKSSSSTTPPTSIPFEAMMLSLSVQCSGEDRNVMRRNALGREQYWNIIRHKPVTSSVLRVTRDLKTGASSLPKTRPRSSSSTTHYLPPVPLDPSLQSYFSDMRRIAVHTIHPLRIHAEALAFAASISGAERERHGEERVTVMARILFFSGISNIIFTRSVALLVYDILVELATQFPDLRGRLEKKIVDLVVNAFSSSWADDVPTEPRTIEDGNGLTPPRRLSEAMHTDMLNASAFLGALFSLGLVQVQTMQAAIAQLALRPHSNLRCRGLHLLLLHASPTLGPSVNLEHLSTWRESFAWHARNHSNDMRKRWLVEILGVVNGMAEQALGVPESQSMTLRWDPGLTCESLHGLCKYGDRFRAD
ncbi:hypothetical protein BV25DRAFT_1903199 [Artomyces pyxidatus]|uniref:Uncharacterized protein n=1 Tax=Artomyces pyxidatus TaxID=48021 RepID=A0ACB8SJ18_9AGAM|nr:hypothetical protein BV25DRAFT_1903199 [Artomyces pyxidatus]